MPRKIKRVGSKNAASRSDKTRPAANRRGTSASPPKLVPSASGPGLSYAGDWVTRLIRRRGEPAF